MDTANAAGEVRSELSQGVRTITFSHPSHNAMPGEQLKRLTQAISDAGDDPETRVIILQSGGEKTFCAGASFDELASIQDLDEGKAFFMGFAQVINACRTCSKPIIGRIQGKAVGGGIGIAASTDYCFAARSASIRLSELAVGIGPFVVGPAIERKMGSAVFRQLALRPADWFSAEWARNKGLYQEVLEDLDSLDKAVETLAHQLASYNPDALKELKKVFWQGTEHWGELLAERAAISGTLVLSTFTRNAIAAFKNG